MQATTMTAAKPVSLRKSKPFLILLASALFLNIGNKVYEIVLPLIMYEITHHSSVAMTTMRTAELLPNLLFAVFIGVFVIGFAFSIYVTSVYTFRHEQTPAHLMGRISGITGCLFRLGMPLTMYVSGWMMLWWGTSSIFISAVVWNVILLLLFVKTSAWKLP
ncbi:hypothetical protein KDJ56_07610 [Brevibacillus composti]|uniref:MFS transporter n=1 Tax=Brevibacillus composti TaxID=2796470 RepID=A0A7T5ENH3_9BACL|nr:hypothetical protein [Brevibacillus composti]QQE75792.1 hypothetical protein JD108_07930 [Brevibacillus composti]QUO42818.1 hypothetical protein KDJ56_07610 [Brevibacillus composti]